MMLKKPGWVAKFPEWAARWEVLARQLMTEAATRGGAASSTGGQVRLHAPDDSEGTCLRVVLLEEESAKIVGEGFSMASSWSLDDEPDRLILCVKAIMDGHAVVSHNGQVLVPIPGGGSVAVGDPLSEPNRRTIPAWQPVK